MKIRSAVLSFTDEELNEILNSLDLPVSQVTVKSTMGRLSVRVRKGITMNLWITFSTDGRHLTATIDAGALANPFVGGVLSRLIEKAEDWGVSRSSKTVVLDPQTALAKAGILGELAVERTAVGAGEIVFALEGHLPLKQFIRKEKG